MTLPLVVGLWLIALTPVSVLLVAYLTIWATRRLYHEWKALTIETPAFQPPEPEYPTGTFLPSDANAADLERLINRATWLQSQTFTEKDSGNSLASSAPARSPSRTNRSGTRWPGRRRAE